MRFMIIARMKTTDPDAFPTAAEAATMMEYNYSLRKAGVLLALDGLYPPSTGAHISYADGKATVTDGPFPEAKEVIGGYWVIQARSREEAIEWFRRAPVSNRGIVEVRRIFERSDAPEAIQKAPEGFEEELRDAAAATA